MVKTSEHTVKFIHKLRKQGLTYTEIQAKLPNPVSKSTISIICREVILDSDARTKLEATKSKLLAVSRQKALAANHQILADRIHGLHQKNTNLITFMQSREAKLVALAMLYLGEGAKWRSRRGMMLVSSDPRIIKLYLSLIYDCFGISALQCKFRVQHRADQSATELVSYWASIVDVPLGKFYPSYIDKRTVGKTTKKSGYKGVCAVMCAGTNVQLELEQIAGIIIEAV